MPIDPQVSAVLEKLSKFREPHGEISLDVCPAGPGIFPWEGSVSVSAVDGAEAAKHRGDDSDDADTMYFPCSGLVDFFDGLPSALADKHIVSLQIGLRFLSSTVDYVTQILVGLAKLKHSSIKELWLSGIPLNNTTAWTLLYSALAGSNFKLLWASDNSFEAPESFGADGLAKALPGLASSNLETLSLGIVWPPDYELFGAAGWKKILTSIQQTPVKRFYFCPGRYGNKELVAHSMSVHELAKEVLPALKGITSLVLECMDLKDLGVAACCKVFRAFASTDVTDLTFHTYWPENFGIKGLAHLVAALEKTKVTTFRIDSMWFGGSYKFVVPALAHAIAALSITKVETFKLGRIDNIKDFKPRDLARIFSAFKHTKVTTVGVELKPFFEEQEKLADALMHLKGSAVNTVLLLANYEMPYLDTMEAKQFAASLQIALQQRGLDIKVELEQGTYFASKAMLSNRKVAKPQPSFLTRSATAMLTAFSACCTSKQCTQVFNPGAVVAPARPESSDSLEKDLLSSQHRRLLRTY